jgi:hypothetical protein
MEQKSIYFDLNKTRPLERFRVPPGSVKRKIFGIGLSRTGTTSLTQALYMLGYKTVHCPLDAKLFDQHDAFTDTSVAVQFDALDHRYPGSKFIYTVRDEDSWLRSCRRFFTAPSRDPQLRVIRQALYRCDQFDATLFADAYKRHDLLVNEYFANRPGDLLTINICEVASSPWEAICAFLETDVPSSPFPWQNRTSK